MNHALGFELDFGHEEYLEIVEVFPQVLRRSAFTFVMALLEADLNEVCEELHAIHGGQFRVYDLQGHGLERAATYVRGIVGVHVSQFEPWGELRNLRRIRDVLVHSNGRIRACQLNESIAQIARGHQYVDLVPINEEDPEGDHVILVKSGLAEHSTDCAERFWNRLAQELPVARKRTT